MNHDPEKGQRRSIRLKGYDYSQPGAYFVTVCSYDHQSMFGRCLDEEMALSKFGEIVAACWHDIPRHFQDVELDTFVIMPNHVHGIVVIARDTVCALDDVGRGDACVAPTASARPETTIRRCHRGVFQIRLHKTHQQIARHAGGASLAAELLRTHHPQRGRLESHPRIHSDKSATVGA